MSACMEGFSSQGFIHWLLIGHIFGRRQMLGNVRSATCEVYVGLLLLVPGNIM